MSGAYRQHRVALQVGCYDEAQDVITKLQASSEAEGKVA